MTITKQYTTLGKLLTSCLSVSTRNKITDAFFLYCDTKMIKKGFYIREGKNNEFCHAVGACLHADWQLSGDR